MGWQGRIIGDQAGEGIGAWLKWLRTAAPQTSLGEARGKLAACLGAEAPARVWEPPLAAAATMPSHAAKPSALRVLVITLLMLLLLVAGGWLWSWLGSK